MNSSRNTTIYLRYRQFGVLLAALLLPCASQAFNLTQIYIHTIESRIEGKIEGFKFRIVLNDADGDLSNVQVTSPNGQAIDLVEQPAGGEFVFESPSFITLAELRALYPLGDYTFNFDNGAATGILPHTASVPSDSPEFAMPLNREVVGQVDPTVVLDDVACGNCFYGSLDLMEAHRDHYLRDILTQHGIPFPASDSVLSSVPLVPGQRVYRFGVSLRGPYSFMVRTYSGVFAPAAIAGDVFNLGSGGIRENRVDIMVAAQLGGTTYYVDSQTGDDSNVGINQLAPLKTLAAVNAIDLLPGDTVLLKRGELWREALHLHEDGGLFNYIRIGAYGQGARPRIRPVEVYQDRWLTNNNQIYFQATSKPAVGDDFAGAIWENETRMQFVSSMNELDAPGEAWWGNGILYIWPSGNSDPNLPNTTYRVSHVVAPNNTSLGVDLRGNFYIVEDLDIAYVGHYGIGQQYKTSRDNGGNVIRRNVVAHSFHDLIAFGQYGGTVENNVVQNSQDFGIACLDVGAGNTSDVIVRNNVIANCRIGLAPEGSVDNIRWHGNTVLWCDKGISAVSEVGDTVEHKPIRNSFKDNLLVLNNVGILLGGHGANFDIGTTIQGNMIISSTQTAIAWAPSGISAVSSVRDNVIDKTGGSAILLAGQISGLELSGNIITGASTNGTAAIDIGPAANGISIMNNTLHGNNAGIVFRGDSYGNSLRNNIVTESSTFNLFMSVQDNISQSSHNIYYGNFSSGEGIFLEGLSNITLQDIQDIGLETSSAFIDPLMVDPSNGDLSLDILSPAIDSGYDTGRTQDTNGNAIYDTPGVANTGTGMRPFMDRGAQEFTGAP